VKLVCGIDLGLEGGVAFMDLAGDEVWAAAMPTRKNSHGGKDVDVLALRVILRDQTRDRGCERLTRVVIEHTHAFGKERPKSIFSFGRGTGRVQALLELEGYGYEEVQPTAWKKVVLAGTKRDKAAAIGWVRGRWPRLMTQDKDGIADAVCLAEYARRLTLGAADAG
jgi:hypothetical protein